MGLLETGERAAILVGEQNPWGADPYYALYPAPDGCAGHRLCRLVLGMSRPAYLRSFWRHNLCAGKWSVPAARREAALLVAEERRVIALGAKVTAAFGFEFRPYEQVSPSVLCLPHPSGMCRLWNEPGAFERARRAVVGFIPELVDLVGECDAQSA